MKKVPIQQVISLLQDFLDERIVAEEFTASYLSFKKAYSTPADSRTTPVEQAYLTGQIGLEEFKAEFKRLMPDMMDESLFAILEDLYEDIDAYSPDWTAEAVAESPYRLDEAGLRKEAADALRQLEQYQLSHGA